MTAGHNNETEAVTNFIVKAIVVKKSLKYQKNKNTMFLKILLFANILLSVGSVKYYKYNERRHRFSWPMKLMPSTSKISGMYSDRMEYIYIWCEVNADSITWLHNSKEINEPPPYELTWEHGSVLMVRPLIKGRTDGTYECVARRGRVIQTKKITLVLESGKKLSSGIPKIKTQPRNIHTARSKVDFNCVVSGKAPIDVIWFHNRRPVSTDSVYKETSVSVRVVPGERYPEFHSNLMLQNFSVADTGFYQCVAINQFGQVVSNQAHTRFQYTDLIKKRVRRSTANKPFVKLDYCRAASDEVDPHGFPRNVTNVRTFCHQESEDSIVLRLQWVPSPYHRSKYVDWYQLFLIEDEDHDERMCFNVSKTESDVSIGIKDGFKLDVQYIVGVTPYPVGPGLTNVELAYCEKTTTATSTTTTTTSVSTLTTTGPVTVVAESVQNQKPKDLGMIIGAAAGALVFLIIIMVVIYYMKMNFVHGSVIPPPRNERRVYVSHCTEGNEDEERLLKLVTNLYTFSLNVCIDLCNQVAINNAGGIPHWVSEKISSADKILLVITPMYLKALTSNSENEEVRQQNVCKVHMEFNYIRNLMYYNCHRIPQLVIVLDGVKSANIPSILQGRFLCQFPKHFREDDNWFGTLVALLFDVEPRKEMCA